MNITLENRRAASSILLKAGAYHEAKRREIAHQIGMDETLVWYALKMTKWGGTSQFMAKDWVIEKILEWGKE